MFRNSRESGIDNVSGPVQGELENGDCEGLQFMLEGAEVDSVFLGGQEAASLNFRTLGEQASNVALLVGVVVPKAQLCGRRDPGSAYLSKKLFWPCDAAKNDRRRGQVWENKLALDSPDRFLLQRGMVGREARWQHNGVSAVE